MPAFRIPVRLYGVLRESAGAPALEVDLAHGSTVSDLRSAVAAHPSVAGQFMGAAVAVNRTYAAPDQVVEEGDEVAIIPPVAGG